MYGRMYDGIYVSMHVCFICTRVWLYVHTNACTYVCLFACMYEELNDVYASPNIVRVIKSRRLRWAGYVARMEEGRGVHKVLVGKPEGKRPLGRLRCRWEDNIKMDLQEVGKGCGDWMEFAQDRDRWRALVRTVMNFGVP